MSKSGSADALESRQVRFKPDPWLALIFSREVFQLALPDTGAIEVKESDLVSAAVNGTAFYYAKVPADRLDQVHALTMAGFKVVDVNMTFERAPAAGTGQTDNRVVARDIRPDEHEAVLKIAASCFVYSRFHLDPLIPNKIADAVKRAWIESYVEKRRGERLLVATREGELAGFLAVLASTANGQSTRVIDLVGVDRSHQSRGIGKALVNSFISECYGTCEVLRVGTQVGNIPSMRLYEQCGFRIVDTAYVLHAHVTACRIQK